MDWECKGKYLGLGLAPREVGGVGDSVYEMMDDA